MRSKYFLSAAMLVAATGTLQAQKSNTSGFMLNLHLNGSSFKAAEQDGVESETESGGGLGFRVGYGFTPKLTLFLGGDAATVAYSGEGAPSGDFTFSHGDLGLTYNFAGSSKSLVPYLEIAFTTIRASDDDEDTSNQKVEQTGNGFTFGGGIHYFFSTTWALQVGLDITGSSLEDLEVDGAKVADTGGSASSARFLVGVTWYPQKR